MKIFEGLRQEGDKNTGFRVIFCPRKQRKANPCIKIHETENLSYYCQRVLEYLNLNLIRKPKIVFEQIKL